VYYDSRNFSANDSAQVFVSYSIDGGETFQDIPVSDQSFQPRQASTNFPYFMGDYIGISAMNGVIWPVWNDNRTGIHQAYTSRTTYSPTPGPDGIFSTKDITFGPVAVGSYKDTTFAITNYGDDTLKVSNITSNTPKFSARPTSFNVAPGRSFVDTVRYAPSVSDVVLGRLIVSSNNPILDTLAVSGGVGTTGGDRVSSEIPETFTLPQNFPNPFNPTTHIRFVSPLTSHVSLKIFDLLGQEVAMLVDEEMSPGNYEVTWDATGFPSGVYFYRLEAGEFVQTKKLVLLR
jgi:hypothetical protein